jgi:hypothetical protein
MNPVVRGIFTATHKLKVPNEFDLLTGKVVANEIGYRLAISGGWFVQTVTIDSTGAVYDWLRRQIRLLPGLGQVHLNGVDIYAGTPIDSPPAAELVKQRNSLRREIAPSLVLIDGVAAREPVPNIDSLVEPSDLDLFLPEPL